MTKSEPTIITLVLSGGGSQRQGMLLIQRAELAKVSQFTFSKMSDITAAIHTAANALAELEIDPPKLVESQPTNGGKGKTKRPSETASTLKAGEPVEDDLSEAEEEGTDNQASNPKTHTEPEDDKDQLPRLL
jgi:hypothetical protein